MDALSKTEFIYFGSQQLLQKCNAEDFKVINETISQCDKVKYLGGTLDSSLQFKTHMTNKCKAAMVNLIQKNTSENTLTTTHATH